MNAFRGVPAPRGAATTLCALLLGVAGSSPSLAATDAAAAPSPECRCRVPGGELTDLGTVACFDLGGAAVAMRCEMSTNTPYWRRVDGPAGCPAPS